MDEDEFNIEALTRSKTEREAKARAEAIRAAGGDPELEAILLETKHVQKETLDSTQRSVKMLKETITVADRTNEKLTAQGEQLERIRETAERADANADESYASAKALHKYKGLLAISMKNMFKGKDKKEQDRLLEEARLEYEAAKKDHLASKGVSNSVQAGQAASGPKKQYADETEQEINDNLDEISKGLAHLKTTGLAMQTKMKEQENTMDYISKTADHTNYAIGSSARKIKEFE